MSIAYSGGPNVNRLHIGVVTRTQVCDFISADLVLAGWTSVVAHATSAIINLVPGAPPLNNTTVTLDGKVYTFKTAINNANNGEVLIGLDDNASMTNLKKAVNLEAGAGTAYSTATTAHTTIRVPTNPAVISTSSIGFEQITVGNANLAVSTNVSAWVWSTTLVNSANLIGGGYKITSAVTPEFQQFQLYVFDRLDTNTQIRINVRNTSESEQSHGAGNGFLLFGDATTDLRVIANPYQCVIMVDGITRGSMTNRFFVAGVPKIPTLQKAKEVSGATNASPIVITTATNHNYTTGDTVTIRRVLGNLAANVTDNVIIVLSATTFSLTGTTGNGVFSGNGVVGNTGPDVTKTQVAEAIWAQGGNSSTNFRSDLGVSTTCFCALNGSSWYGGGNSAGTLTAIVPTTPNTNTRNLTFFNSSFFTSEAWLAWGKSSSGAGFVIGQMWDAVFTMANLPPDLAGGGPYDSHSWWGITDNNPGSSGLTTGSLMVVVP